MLADLDWQLGLATTQHTRDRRQPLACARGAIAPIEDGSAASRALKRVEDAVTPGIERGRLELRDQLVAVAIDDESGQTICLPEHEADGRRLGTQRLATLHSAGDPL